MVSYPGCISIVRGRHGEEPCVAITIADASGRAAPVVVLDDLGRFSRALTGEGQQPCAVQAAQYPAPPAVADRGA